MSIVRGIAFASAITIIAMIAIIAIMNLNWSIYRCPVSILDVGRYSVSKAKADVMETCWEDEVSKLPGEHVDPTSLLRTLTKICVCHVLGMLH